MEDRYDEVLAMLRSIRGMPIETALKIKASKTILVQVGEHSDHYADVETLCLNHDGSRHTPTRTMIALIDEYFPQAIAPCGVWRARYEHVRRNLG